MTFFSKINDEIKDERKELLNVSSYIDIYTYPLLLLEYTIDTVTFTRFICFIFITSLSLYPV